VDAAKTFLRSAMRKTRRPTKITLDAYAASHRAVREMKEAGELPRRVKVRSSPLRSFPSALVPLEATVMVLPSFEITVRLVELYVPPVAVEDSAA
jgi:transposase-like protein